MVTAATPVARTSPTRPVRDSEVVTSFVGRSMNAEKSFRPSQQGERPHRARLGAVVRRREGGATLRSTRAPWRSRSHRAGSAGPTPALTPTSRAGRVAGGGPALPPLRGRSTPSRPARQSRTTATKAAAAGDNGDGRCTRPMRRPTDGRSAVTTASSRADAVAASARARGRHRRPRGRGAGSASRWPVSTRRSGVAGQPRPRAASTSRRVDVPGGVVTSGSRPAPRRTSSAVAAPGGSTTTKRWSSIWARRSPGGRRVGRQASSAVPTSPRSRRRHRLRARRAHGDAGMAAAERADEGRRGVDGRVGKRDEVEVARQDAPDGGRPDEGSSRRPAASGGPAPPAPRRPGERTCGRPDGTTVPQLGLEGRIASGERRLSDVSGLARPGEAPVVDDRDGVAELAKIHR